MYKIGVISCENRESLESHIREDEADPVRMAHKGHLCRGADDRSGNREGKDPMTTGTVRLR